MQWLEIKSMVNFSSGVAVIQITLREDKKHNLNTEQNIQVLKLNQN